MISDVKPGYFNISANRFISQYRNIAIIVRNIANLFSILSSMGIFLGNFISAHRRYGIWKAMNANKIGPSGWKLNACANCPWAVEAKERVIPQNAHLIPKVCLRKQ